MPAATEHMTVREVADELGVSTQRVYKMVRDHALPSVRPWPRTVFIPRDAVEAHKQGAKTVRPTLAGVQRYITDHTGGVDVRSINGETLFDLCFEYAIDCGLSVDDARTWAATMSTRLVAP